MREFTLFWLLTPGMIGSLPPTLSPANLLLFHRKKLAMNTLQKRSCYPRLPAAFVWAWLLTMPGAQAVEPSDPGLSRKAENGDASSMLRYGRTLITTSSPDALAWVRKAAAAFDEEGNRSGLMEACLDLVEFSPDKEEAGRAKEQVTAMIEGVADATPDGSIPAFAELQLLLERAYALEIPAAASLIGKSLREAGDAKQAFEWYSKAATKGYPPAMVQVGLMYSNGDGVETNMEKAASWLRPANVKKSASGKHLLAECFLHGKGVQTNPKLAAQLLQEAISLQASGRSFDLLATCYHKGWGVEPDSRKAAQFYQQACENKYYNAYANLAVLYMTGAGVTKDEATAVDLLHAGIEQGDNPLCMYFLGLARWEGKGIRKSKRKARQWLVRAAEAGNEQAQAWCTSNEVAWIHPE